MTKKILLSTLLACTLTSQIIANDATEQTQHDAESKLYVVTKALTILGDNEGDTGYGFGIDFGYRLEKGFAVEYDFSYSTNTIEEEDATYMTHSLDLLYTYHLTHKLGTFAKVGYEYESASIGSEDESDTGYILGAGLEYALTHSYGVVAEYEHSSIESTRGDSIYAGVLFNF
jgi:opacity protein-like surface antigen